MNFDVIYFITRFGKHTMLCVMSNFVKPTCIFVTVPIIQLQVYVEYTSIPSIHFSDNKFLPKITEIRN